MKANKKVRGALITSVISLVLCFTMLLGTTLAWFTDTASTSVNKIQAGTLEVGLEYATAWDSVTGAPTTWANAEGQTLNFRKADGTTEVLWEPGCTYKLPEIRVVNNGNLALKYVVTISGLTGNAKLLDVITFTANGDTNTFLNGVAGSLVAGTASNPTRSDPILLQGHMAETAGNEYQGLSIDGIAVTVNATQLANESDSFGNQYDNSAMVPVSTNAKGTVKVDTTDNTVAEEAVLSDKVMTVTYPAGVKLAQTATGTTADVEQKLEYKAGTPTAGITVGANETVEQYELTLPVANDNGVLVEVSIQRKPGLTGLKVYHAGVELSTTPSTSVEYFEYDTNTGVVTLHVFHASPIDLVFTTPVAVIGDVRYDSLNAAVAAANADDTVVLLKDTNGDGIGLYANPKAGQTKVKNLTIDFNGHTYTIGGALQGSTGTVSQAFHLEKDCKVTLKNGTLTTTNAKMLVQNYCDLTLDNMVLEGAGVKGTYVSSNNNGNVVIKDTTINAEGKVAFDVCRYSSYVGPNVTVSGNSVINGKVEVSSDGAKEGAVHKLNVTGGTFNGEIVLVGSNPDFTCNINGGKFVVSTKDGLNNVLANAAKATVVLANDIELADTAIVTGDVTLDMNGHKLYNTTKDIWNTSDHKWSLVSVRENGNLVVTGNGTFAAKLNDCYAIDVNGATAKCVIEDGEFIGNIHSVYVHTGALTVNGGKFSVQQKYSAAQPDDFVLNCLDANYRNGSATFTVNGGTFYGFNPTAAKCEGGVKDFTNGKTVDAADGWYTVQ